LSRRLKPQSQYLTLASHKL